VLAGLMRPRGGRRLTPGGVRAQPGRDIGLLGENPLDQLLTERVDDEVALGPRNWAVFDGDAHERTLSAADLIDLRERAPLALSVGQQQRTALAAALALEPRLLILDEPTLGQDWSHLERLMDFVADLNARGSTILLITHDHDLAARYARRVLIMRSGRIVADGALEELEEVEA
jgi:energy-coupling factor transport system ATP-binding protein